MNYHPTRRTLMGAIAVAPLAAVPINGRAVATPIPDVSEDPALVAAWESRKAAHCAIYDLPDDQAGAFFDSLEEKRLWAMTDKAEALIADAKAKTPRGVIIQLLTALAHSISDRDLSHSADCGNLVQLHERGQELDWDERLILSAIRSLQAMSGEL